VPLGCQPENILIWSQDHEQGTIFKLGDFGSATTVALNPAVMTATELAMHAEEIEANTTLSYRAPEQVDLYRRAPLDERVDIWVQQRLPRHQRKRSSHTDARPSCYRSPPDDMQALGCLLYKLAYYQDAFRDKLDILNRPPVIPDDRRVDAVIPELIRTGVCTASIRAAKPNAFLRMGSAPPALR